MEIAPSTDKMLSEQAEMRLNTISPAPGSKKKPKRLGRGIGCTDGKTCGRGHKGQRARAGGYHKVGFEGGQTPIQRRIPKSGFRSRSALYRQEVYVSALEKIEAEVIDLHTLMMAGLIARNIKEVKIIASGELKRAVHVKGVLVSKGARAIIEAAKGTVEA